MTLKEKAERRRTRIRTLVERASKDMPPRDPLDPRKPSIMERLRRNK